MLDHGPGATTCANADSQTYAERGRSSTVLFPRTTESRSRRVFGNLGAFVNGNMFMGAFGPDVTSNWKTADERALGRLKSFFGGPSVARLELGQTSADSSRVCR